ncbi:anti-sigma regulatory factor [Streptomyces sp. ASQP_92]|uniref:anti-sigma regulatory factor n=1 Tax=Streptomyces sp. ASQP_92 TaxID=2979116 RepID=UPI0021C20DCF|nr:anti-sigma regulatory factor [Streptomyces sp. ASQP_92]MCT9089979.1 anti-sigma regulatory factor [Streptomyces sp. ASQP_92]
MTQLANRRATTVKRPAGDDKDSERLVLHSEEDLLSIRHAVRAASVKIGFGIIDQTRIVTAASELARNAYVHGGGGALTIDCLRRGSAEGLRLTISDNGPGIPDLDAALTDGFTTGAGLGHGLGGARRLMHDFEVHTAAGKGTTVIATRWTGR